MCPVISGLSAVGASAQHHLATPRIGRVRKVRRTISWTIFINLICSDEKKRAIEDTTLFQV